MLVKEKQIVNGNPGRTCRIDNIIQSPSQAFPQPTNTIHPFGIKYSNKAHANATSCSTDGLHQG